MGLKKLLKIKSSHYGVRQILRWLWQVWKGNLLQASINASLGILEVIVSLGSVWATQRAMDVASGTVGFGENIVERHFTLTDLYWAVALMGLLMIGDFSVRMLGMWIKNILGIKAQNRMQQKMLDRMLRSEWHGKETRHSGDVLNRLEQDVNTVVKFLTETVPNTVSVLAMFFGAFFYLFSMDKLLAVITIAILPIFISFSRIYVGKMRNLTRMVRDSDSQVQSVLQETIQHRMLIKTLESDSAMVDKLEDTQSRLRHNVVRQTLFSMLSHFILHIGFSLGYIIAFLWAAVRLYNHTLTFGGMTAFLQLVGRIQMPARNLAQILPAFVSVLTASERLMELESDPMEEQGEPIYMKAPLGIRVENVSYGYDDADGAVIDKMNFNFLPGSCTAILGETGSGKTTLVRMILALLRPKSGHIYLYNDKQQMELSARMRCNFVYVPQGNTLLCGTIRDNLRLGKINASEEEMLEALHHACADFVMQLPDGLDTVCSEQGGGLSEGQAQRITIARALLRDRSIMLFDEATSALDPETEKQLLKNILATNDKTVIFITHRPAVVDYCDQTLKIDRQIRE